MCDLLLGYDIGTTGVKTAVFSAEGELLASTYRQYSTYYPGPSRVEQRPTDWWNSIVRTTHEIVETSTINKDAIAGISFSGQMLGQIPIDHKGRLVLNQVPIWADSRASHIKDAFLERFGGHERFYDTTMQGMNPELYSLFKILWFKEHEPEVFGKTWKFLHTKDYIGFRMSGNLATDYSDQATGCVLDLSRRTWAQEILDTAGITLDLFPELHESTDRLGELRREAAEEMGLPPGIPLFVGSGDAPASAAGALAVNPGDLYFYMGSAAWGGSIESRPVGDFVDRITVLPHVVSGLYHSQVVMNTGAIAQQWTVENLYGKRRNHYELAIEEAANMPIGEDTILFLPFLRGGGAPFNNMHARGVFSGVAIEHTRAHLFRAAIEGFAFKLRYVIERFERFRETKIDRFTIIGGGARNSFWMKLIANITRKKVVTTKLKQASNCFAAAMLAGIGTGLLRNYQSIDKKRFFEATFSPDGKESHFYEKKYQAFLIAYENSIEVFDLLASLKEEID